MAIRGHHQHRCREQYGRVSQARLHFGKDCLDRRCITTTTRTTVVTLVTTTTTTTATARELLTTTPLKQEKKDELQPMDIDAQIVNAKDDKTGIATVAPATAEATEVATAVITPPVAIGATTATEGEATEATAAATSTPIVEQVRAARTLAACLLCVRA